MRSEIGRSMRVSKRRSRFVRVPTTHGVVVSDKIVANQREIHCAGVRALLDEVQLVSSGSRFTGEVAGMNQIGRAVPGGLSFKIQLSRRFRRLNPDRSE